jgi:hypothetical protein
LTLDRNASSVAGQVRRIEKKLRSNTLASGKGFASLAVFQRTVSRAKNNVDPFVSSGGHREKILRCFWGKKDISEPHPFSDAHRANSATRQNGSKTINAAGLSKLPPVNQPVNTARHML